MGVWPDLIAGPDYVPDFDGLLYVTWARGVVLDGSWSLIDGVHDPSGPMMHPWALFVPPAQLARLTGLDVGFVWRLLGGSGIALGLFAAIRPWTRSAATAAGVAAFLLADAGLLVGQILQREVEVVGFLFGRGPHLLDGVPRLMPHFRAPTTAIAVAALLFHLGATRRAVERGDRRSILFAGLTFGALFHLFFYFWTAAGLALALAFLFDRRNRRTYFAVGLIGGLVGVPSVIQAWLVKADTPRDWLLRTDKFVPIGRFENLLVPKLLIVEFALLTFLVFWKRLGDKHAWRLALAGLLLVNEQVFTALEIENFHWSYALGVGFSILLTTIALDWFEPIVAGRRRLRMALAALVVVYVVAGFAFRSIETFSAESLRIRFLEGVWARSKIEPRPGSVVAGDPSLLFAAAARRDFRPLAGRLVEYSSKTTDAELDARFLLNRYLLGRSADEVRVEAEPRLKYFGQDEHARRDPIVGRARFEARLALIDSIWGDPGPWLDRFEVTQLVLPDGAVPPEGVRERFRRREGGGGGLSLWDVSR